MSKVGISVGKFKSKSLILKETSVYGKRR